MSSEDDSRLIVGLGNPGARYEMTRHNFGFMVVRAFAKKQGWSWKRTLRFNGELASGSYSGAKLFLLLPMTYMNLSGNSVGKFARYHHIELTNLMVVVDDVDVPFGKVRLRPKGSAAGHNGLTSVQQNLQTQEYPRLRMGINGEFSREKPLEDYVLENFSATERKDLPQLIEKGVDLLECWITQGMESAIQLAGSKT